MTDKKQRATATNTGVAKVAVQCSEDHTCTDLLTNPTGQTWKNFLKVKVGHTIVGVQ
jgi:hypothetical protein